MKKIKTWDKGEEIEYTGQSEYKHGSIFFYAIVLTGHEKGKEIVTTKCPDCGLRFGQDQPAAAPCFTCNIELYLQQHKQ